MQECRASSALAGGHPACRLGIAIAAVVLLVGGILGCRDSALDAGAVTHVRAGYIPFSADLPFFVALEQGYFEKRGVVVEPVRFAVSSECLNAAVAGRIDFAMGNSLSSLLAIEQKQPGTLKVFLPMFETEDNHVSHLLVRKGSLVRRVAELKGRRVGTYAGATQLLYLRLFLERQGLKPGKDVEIVQVADNLQVPALESGQFDALFTIEPYCTMAMEMGIAESILPFARGRIVRPFPGGAMSVRAKYCAERAATCGKVVEALEEAAVFIRLHPQEAKRTLAKYTPVDEAVAVRTGVYEWLPRADMTGSHVASLQEEANLFAEYKILDGTVRAEQMILGSEESR
jgi:NitT/TauT family transport system substrate-binding protein